MPPASVLEGKRVLITGAAGGVGRAVAERMLAKARDCLLPTATPRELRRDDEIAGRRRTRARRDRRPLRS